MSHDHLDKPTTKVMENEELKTMVQSFILETTLVDAPDQPNREFGERPQTKGQRYEMADVLGAGGMGIVLRAHDKNLQRSVAMKVLQKSRVTDGTHALRFVREAEITGALEHPNIIPLHELGLDAANNAYYTMKQVKGETLKTILKKLKEHDPDYVADYPFQRLIEIFLKVCEAMELAHDRGIIHRDLKPENIMVGDFGEVLVIDWGLARKLDEEESFEAVDDLEPEDNPLDFVTQAGAVMGTPGYMSPEQVRGRQVGRPSDIFSLGAILYTILTFKPPVTGRNIRDIIVKLLKGEICPPEEYWREQEDGVTPSHLPGKIVPPGISAVAMKALALRQDNRYTSVKKLKQDVENFQAGFATEAEGASLLRQIGLLISRSRKTVAAVLCVAAALLAYCGIFAWNLDRERATAEEREELAFRMKAKADATAANAQEVFANLKEKAPALAKQARYDLQGHNTGRALYFIDQAIFLDPDNGSLHELRGDILQNRFRFLGAAEAYRQARSKDGAVPGLFEKERWSRKLAGAPEQEFLETLKTLYQHFHDSGRYQESLNVLHQLGFYQELYLETGQALLKEMPWKASLTVQSDMLFGHDGSKEIKAIRLDITRCSPYFDFQDIRGIGIKDLQISGAAFLTGWEGLVSQNELFRLHIHGMNTVDFAKFQGLKIKDLTVISDSMTNISSLNTMGILNLSLGGAGVTDSSINGLASNEIKKLVIKDSRISKLDIVADLPMVETIQIVNTPVEDLSVFETMPGRNFKKLYLNNTNVESLLPLSRHGVADFDCSGSQILSLRGLNVSNLNRLICRSTRINSLDYLAKAGCPKLTKIDISLCPVRDLSPLTALPNLRNVMISGAPVTDLSPLAKIKWLQLTLGTPAVKDITPVITPNLASIRVDLDAIDAASIRALRQSPNLQKINSVNAKRYWINYDRKHSNQ